MVLSLGLRLYNLTARREGGTGGTGWPARPAGRLVWVHGPRPEGAQGLSQMAWRLADEDGVAILATGAGLTGAIAPPEDTEAEVAAFLDHFRPELIILGEGELRPVLVHVAAARKLPVLMVDARAPWLARGREGWFPGLMRGALGQLRAVLAVDEAAARAFRKAGAVQVEVAGRMEEASAVLGAPEAERAALARLLATRPVWLAADVPESEEAAVIQAHRACLRLAHRLLLILVPRDPARGPALAARMQAEEGWAVAMRCRDEEPEAETEVYLADNAQEYGLWYRLAPVSFLGGSLLGEGPSRNPLEAAALGSAILHGPRPGVYGAALGRLGAARAARAVASGADLAEALGDLLAPDRAARLAQAAWGVASEGAEVTERVLALVRRLMDGEEG